MSYFGEFSVVTDSSFKEYKGGVLRQTLFNSFEYSPVCHFSVQTRLSQSRSHGFLVPRASRSLSRYALKSSTCEQVYVQTNLY